MSYPDIILAERRRVLQLAIHDGEKLGVPKNHVDRLRAAIRSCEAVATYHAAAIKKAEQERIRVALWAGQEDGRQTS